MPGSSEGAAAAIDDIEDIITTSSKELNRANARTQVRDGVRDRAVYVTCRLHPIIQ